MDNLLAETTIIAFSKNRACQLELLLRSLDAPITVIYTYGPEFKAGYDKLKGMYPQVDFVLQTDFKSQVIERLGDYTMFMVDDEIVLEPLNCPEFSEFKRDEELICLSLRLAYHHRRCPVRQGKWRWEGLRSHWGYPMAVASHIFRIGDIENVMKRESFNDPNELEEVLRRHPPSRPYMRALDRPKTIINQANAVQNRAKPGTLSPRYLEDLFLDGQRISLSSAKEKSKDARDSLVVFDYEYESI